MNASAFRRLVSLLTVACAPVTAVAQEGINTEAATEPSAGVWMYRQQFRFESYGRDPTGLARRVHESRAISMFSYGLTRDVALNLQVPVVARDVASPQPGGSFEQCGLDDVMLMGQWRFFQHHFGPVETARASLLLGAELPTGTDNLSNDSVAPMIGGVVTAIYGRHGGNVALRYQVNWGGEDEDGVSATFVRPGDGTADAFFYDAAYLYRLAPAVYSRETGGAWYAVLEANGVAETNGDNELLIAPGIMYEGKTFALEASVQLPVWQDIEHRPQTEFTVTVGLRLLF